MDPRCAEQLFAAHQGIANYPNSSCVRYRQHDSANHDTAFSRKRCGSECKLSPSHYTTIHYRSRHSPLYYTVVHNHSIWAIVTLCSSEQGGALSFSEQRTFCSFMYLDILLQVSNINVLSRRIIIVADSLHVRSIRRWDDTPRYNSIIGKTDEHLSSTMSVLRDMHDDESNYRDMPFAISCVKDNFECIWYEFISRTFC